ncbi:FUSC family protein [Microcystis elabens FACHB-917]|nr:FUSC family protein [Microcystis elabens FACHB-917]
MDAQLLRNSLKLAVAALITAALVERFDRIAFAWYPLLAVVIVVDDNDDLTVKAATGRILGTAAGGLITFLVHTIAAGWSGVLLSLLLIAPMLRLLGWQSALSTAALIPVMFLMIPSHAALNWDYVFNRALDTSIGCLVAIAVGLLFWPRDGLQQLEATELGLVAMLRGQLAGYRRWLAGEAARPGPLAPAALGAGLERMETLLHQELNGPRGRRLQAGEWRRRLQLWQSLRLHWLQWERLLVASDPPPPDPSTPNPLSVAIEALAAQWEGRGGADLPVIPLEAWTALAAGSGRSLLTLLALAQEQRPLLESGRELARLRGVLPCP